MNATAPPKPSIILGTPINVEESRTQRLQRQQARFRDRGGLFVPTNRSTLLDILLGKASPLKKLHRNASASPSRADEEKSLTGNEVSEPALRRSPRKQSQKTTNVVTDGQQPPATTDDPESEASKPIKKAASSKSSRPCQQSKAMVPPKRTTKLRGRASESMQAFAVAEDDTNAKGCDTGYQSLTQKASRRTVDALEKQCLRASTRKIIPNANDDADDDVPLLKSKPKGKRVSKMKLQGVVEGAKGTPKTRGREPAIATSTAVTGSIRVKRVKKVESVYSESSEDDAVCKPTKKASTKRVKKSATALEKATSKSSSAQKEEDEECNSGKDVKVSLKSLNASDDGSEDDIPLNKFKSKSKIDSNQGKPQGETGPLKPTKEVESAYSAFEPTKKLSTKISLEGDAAHKQAKKPITKKVKASSASMVTERCKSPSGQKGEGVLNVNEIAPCQLPDIPEEGEGGNSAKEDTAPSGTSSNPVVASKGKRRASPSITQDSDSQPLRKRIKSGTVQPDADLSLRKNSSSSGDAPPLTSKKRRRNPEDAESAVEDSVDKGTKRKKCSGQSESRGVSKIPVKEVNVKPVAKRSGRARATKSTHRTKKWADSDTLAPKQKENAAISKPSKKKNKVTSNSGPPTSVLKRIKDSLGAQVVDDEPDPIDFLS